MLVCYVFLGPRSPQAYLSTSSRTSVVLNGTVASLVSTLKYPTRTTTDMSVFYSVLILASSLQERLTLDLLQFGSGRS